jgi:prophage regulatory protein
MAITILRLPQVKEITGLSRSSIYLRMKEGAFPNSLSLGPRAIGWSSQSIDEWVNDRINSSQNGGKS